MKPFITYREGDDFFILQKEFPHYVGIIQNQPSVTKISFPVAGYNFWVVFNGTIRGMMIPSYKDVVTEIEVCMSAMSNWFLMVVIMKDEKKYKRFKIKTNDTSGV
jgi:hypothetical protein